MKIGKWKKTIRFIENLKNKEKVIKNHLLIYFLYNILIIK